MKRLYLGDALTQLRKLPEGFVNCCVTSPPYWGLRDYGVEGQFGLEKDPRHYIEKIVEVFREVRRVLKKEGTLWLNLGDSYNGSGPSWGPGKSYTNRGSQDTTRKNVAGLKPKDLVGIPWRVALALQADGWYLRSDIIWHKPNVMPESVRDRPTKSHEYIFLLSKSRKYYYDASAVAEPSLTGDTRKPYAPGQIDDRGNGHDRGGGSESGRDPSTRNRRSVWTIPNRAYKGSHFAVFPPDLIRPCILAGCPEGGTVLDPFLGSGTTAFVAEELGREWVGVELNLDYVKLIYDRLHSED